jgi:hypothetical protein
MRMRLRMRLCCLIQATVLKHLFQRTSAQFIWPLVLCLISWSCQPNGCHFEPKLCYTPPPHLIESLPSPFLPLTPVERTQDWGKELFLGKVFVKEMDFYRALTCFKRALFLIPHTHERRLEIEYEIFFVYYVVNKYQEAVEAFESSRLINAPESFPALQDLVVALYDAYIKMDLPERACRILALIETMDARKANNLRLGTAVIDANFAEIADAGSCSNSCEDVNELLTTYQREAKSVLKAQTLNALVPGAGYLYVGQKKSAMTSFLINTLFIATAWQLFDKGYIPAAIIVTSLEAGWYFGGINGAGLEAKQYNENLYERVGRNMLARERLFPILMIEKGF